MTKCKLYQHDEFESEKDNKEIRSIKKTRETYRIIKMAFKSQDNKIEALPFHQKEMEAYKLELNLAGGKWADKAVLRLNFSSNNHGESWKKSLGFTTLITLGLYLLYLLFISSELKFNFSPKAIGIIAGYYIDLLNITKWNYKPFNVNNESWGTLFLDISRIPITFGYYQLIQAFRKFTKN